MTSHHEISWVVCTPSNLGRDLKCKGNGSVGNMHNIQVINSQRELLGNYRLSYLTTKEGDVSVLTSSFGANTRHVTGGHYSQQLLSKNDKSRWLGYYEERTGNVGVGYLGFFCVVIAANTRDLHSLFSFLEQHNVCWSSLFFCKSCGHDESSVWILTMEVISKGVLGWEPIVCVCVWSDTYVLFTCFSVLSWGQTWLSFM